MTHQKLSLNLTLFLLLAFLPACSMPITRPTSISTKALEATLEPTALPTIVPVIIITPIPLPTTVPNQAELIQKVTGKEPIDFVIDTQQLKRGVVPPRFMVLHTWYKYTPSDGAFSVLMHGGVAPKETTVNDQQGTFPSGVKVVRSDYLMEDNQAIAYFQKPDLPSKDHTSQQVLDSFDVAQLMNDAAKVDIISDKRIQLSGFPGRDIVFHATPKDKLDFNLQLYMHVRFYAVGNVIYQLTYADLGAASGDAASPEIERRFLDSFTLNDTAPRS